MSNEKKFNQSKYIQAYIKEKYTECKLRLKPVESEKIDSFCKSQGIAKSRFFINAALYIIDNNIDITSFQADSGNKE